MAGVSHVRGALKGPQGPRRGRPDPLRQARSDYGGRVIRFPLMFSAPTANGPGPFLGRAKWGNSRKMPAIVGKYYSKLSNYVCIVEGAARAECFCFVAGQ